MENITNNSSTSKDGVIEITLGSWLKAAYQEPTKYSYKVKGGESVYSLETVSDWLIDQIPEGMRVEIGKMLSESYGKAKHELTTHLKFDDGFILYYNMQCADNGTVKPFKVGEDWEEYKVSFVELMYNDIMSVMG